MIYAALSWLWMPLGFIWGAHFGNRLYEARKRLPVLAQLGVMVMFLVALGVLRISTLELAKSLPL